MRNPRLIYYNDGHHFHGKRIEPPASIHMLQWPVDEVAGTGVDCLVFGLGYGDVFFHNSKVGRVIGQNKEVWESYIDWRIMRMAEESFKKGTDQLREVINRGRELGISVFPSLKVQNNSVQFSQRCGSLKWDRGKEVCIDEPGAEWCYDYANEAVRQYRLDLLREVLFDYQPDGIELDFMFKSDYFKKADVEKNTPIMTRFLAQVSELAKEAGGQQGREIPVMARVPLKRDDCLAMGLDVEAVFREGSLDFVVGQDGNIVIDTGIQAKWLPDAANAAGGAAYYRPPRRAYDERVGVPSIEMFRALGKTLEWQGYAGQNNGYFLWPFAEREYQILRELGYPEVYARYTKRYMLSPREGVEGEPTTTPERQLPTKLEDGQTVSLNIWVADDVDSARADGEMRKPILTIRYSYYCNEDDIETRFNGKVLLAEDSEINHERALEIKTILNPNKHLQAPLGMSAHWFRYKLDIDDVKRGENVLEIETKKQAPKAGFDRSVNGVEILMRYKDFVRPEGFDVERIAPLSG